VSSLHCMNDPHPEGHMANYIGRRKFLATLGGAAAAWPLASRAEQSPVPVIGFMSARSPSASASLVAGFRQGLADGGYFEGQNVAIDYRWAEGHCRRRDGGLRHARVSCAMADRRVA